MPHRTVDVQTRAEIEAERRLLESNLAGLLPGQIDEILREFYRHMDRVDEIARAMTDRRLALTGGASSSCPPRAARPSAAPAAAPPPQGGS